MSLTAVSFKAISAVNRFISVILFLVPKYPLFSFSCALLWVFIAPTLERSIFNLFKATPCSLIAVFSPSIRFLSAFCCPRLPLGVCFIWRSNRINSSLNSWVISFCSSIISPTRSKPFSAFLESNFNFTTTVFIF